MQVRCKNCIHDSWKTRKDIDTCYDCENFSSFSPKNRKVGRPYHVRVSELRYGEVTVSVYEEDPTVCLVEFSFAVAHGLNQIYLTAHITI